MTTPPPVNANANALAAARGGDPRLDVASPQFDAWLALTADASSVVGLVRDVLPLDNLERARHLLPVDDPDYVPVVAPPPHSSRATHPQTQPHSLPQAPTTEKNPIEAVAASFERGPLSVLRKAVNQRVRVCVRRAHGRVAWCSGTRGGFDRHLNLLLRDGEESREAREAAYVSKRFRGEALRDRVERFLRDFPDVQLDAAAADDEANETVESLCAGSRSEDEVWRLLHARAGLPDKVLASMRRRREDSSLDDALALLRRRAGHEAALLAQLRAKDENKPLPSPAETADWVMLPSEKHVGRFFFHETRTGKSVWVAPPGVSFRRVEVRVRRVEPFARMLVRGSRVVLVSDS